ncbi:signal peptidase I [Bifidobacterium bombi DSM 19703]|uniref:Signal peptidase I n=2 Tax=Bifidobacterium bombi TaxID=471511 RepID=A0A080N5T0_9BIFI|nr:signal peptidase I [Bifidobacterium bombi DSM 19703]
MALTADMVVRTEGSADDPEHGSEASGRSDAVRGVRNYGRRRPAHASSSNRRSDNGSGWLFLRDLIIYCVIPLLVVFTLFASYRIPSGSMMDTIEVGDRVLVTRLEPRLMKPRRGDVVVFKDPAHWLDDKNENMFTDTLIKRLIGLPGDTVECSGKGAPVKVNGVPINETSYLKPGVNPSDFAFKVKVSAGNVFVMGDNRANSADSRWHADDGNDGLVPVHDIKGKGLLTFWPLGRFGALQSHHEVFDAVPAQAVS